MRTLWLVGLAAALSGCPEDGGPKPAASGSATGTVAATATPSTTGTATASATASAAASASDDKGPPWVRGLSKGCKADDDCILVRKCSTHAIRKDAKETFEKRSSGWKVRCELTDAGTGKPLRAACVTGTCQVVTR